MKDPWPSSSYVTQQLCDFEQIISLCLDFLFHQIGKVGLNGSDFPLSALIAFDSIVTKQHVKCFFQNQIVQYC